MRPLALLYITQAAAAVAIGPSTARLSPAAVAAPSWIRATRENDRLVVETASRAYTTPAGAKLTVRGVVHVAEEAYWRDVQNIEGRVLFESLVAASPQRPAACRCSWPTPTRCAPTVLTRRCRDSLRGGTSRWAVRTSAWWASRRWASRC